MRLRAAAAVSLVIALSGCAPEDFDDLAVLPTPAPECGFRVGTELQYAGRSTTSDLGLVRVEDDPIMGVVPADIFITRDAMQQGELHGRLVCAVYSQPAGFVEITVHPADVEPTPEPPPPVRRPGDGITAAEAVEIAREGFGPAWEVRVSESGPVSQVVLGRDGHDWARRLPDDLWVWRVFLVRGDAGADVIVDFVDGTVYGVMRYILN